MKIISIFTTPAPQAAEQLRDEHKINIPETVAQEATGKTSNAVKWFFGILLMLTILAFLLFARKGAAFMFGTAGLIVAWVFAVISIVGVFAYLKGWLPRSLKWILLLFEMINLGFDAYVAGGQWGRASVDTKVVSEINERQTQSEAFVGTLNALIELQNTLPVTAATIKKIEAERDGKGTVYEASAKMEGEFTVMKPMSIIYAPVSKETVEGFQSAEELLSYVITSQRTMIDQEQKLLQTGTSVISKSQSFEKYLEEMGQKMTEGYSQERLANLARLKSSLNPVSNYQLPTPPPMVTWTKADLYSAIGWGDRIMIPIFALSLSFILIWVLWFWGDKGADRRRFDKMGSTLLAQMKLHNSGLRHALPPDWCPEQRDMQLLDLFDDPAMLQQIKRTNLTYEALRATYDRLGNDLFLACLDPTNKWTLQETARLVEEHPEQAGQVVARLSPKTWAMIVKYCDRPSDLLLLDDQALNNIVMLIEALRVKLRGQDDLVNQTVDRLFIEDADASYYEILLRLIGITKDDAQIASITPRLAQAIRHEVLESAVAILTASNGQFIDIANQWQRTDSDTLYALHQRKLLSSVQPVLNHCARGGYVLLSACLEHCAHTLREAQTGLVPKTVSVNPTTVGTIQHLADPVQVRAAFADLFVVA